MNRDNYFFRAKNSAAKMYIFYLRKLSKHPFSRKLRRFISKHCFPKGIVMINGLGVKIAISTFDYIDQEIIFKGSYEAESIHRAREIMKTGGLFLDIGSNAGLYTLHIAGLSSTSACAFEPNPQAFVLLQRNVALNNLQNANLYNIAIGNESKLCGLSSGSKNNLGNYSINTEKADFYSWCMPLSELDLPQQEIKLMKIDVEGFEWQVLQGINWDKQKPRNIIMEFLPKQIESKGHSAMECLNLLIEKGYSVKTISGNLHKDFSVAVPENNLWFSLDE